MKLFQFFPSCCDGEKREKTRFAAVSAFNSFPVAVLRKSALIQKIIQKITLSILSQLL
ncbi:MAG: hypothetical protein N3E41_08870 [Thermofilaceae archaeon]|nr:hypothetical protein [Thermofilaceae archaeon]